MKKLIAIAVVCFSASAARAQLQTALYPLEVGNRWTYVVHNAKDKGKDNTKKTVDVEVERREPYQKHIGYILKNTSGAKVTTEHVVVMEDGVYKVQAAETLLTPPLCLIKLGDKGNTWNVDSKGGTTAIKGTYTVKADTVTVPAGTYEKAFKVSYTNGKSGDKRIDIDCWYVLNIGMVKQHINEKGNEIVLELKKFEAARK